MDKSHVVEALRELIDKEDNQFRATNFKRALRAVEEYDEPLHSLRDLRKVPNIGATIADRLKEHLSLTGEGGFRKGRGGRHTMDVENGDEFGGGWKTGRVKRKSVSEGEFEEGGMNERVMECLERLIKEEPNRFKSLNYIKALRAVEDFDGTIESLDDLRDVPNIGATIVERLREYMGEEFEGRTRHRKGSGWKSMGVGRAKRRSVSESEGESMHERVMECLERLIEDEPNRFKSLNFTKALRAVEDFDGTIESLDDLRHVPNIGATIIERLKEYMGEEFRGRSHRRGSEMMEAGGRALNKKIIAALEQIIEDEPNQFRANNFMKALHALESYHEPIRSEHDIRKVPGIGGTLMSHIQEVLSSGEL